MRITRYAAHWTRFPYCWSLRFLPTVFLLGCGIGDETLETVDPESLPQTVNWEEHVGPILNRVCSTCHGTTSSTGTLSGYNYDDYASTVCDWAPTERSIFSSGTMPPSATQRFDGWESAVLRKWELQEFPLRALPNGEIDRPQLNCRRRK